MMYVKDEIAKRKLELVRQDVRDGRGYTRPRLDLDAEHYRAYRDRKTNILPKPYCNDPLHRMVMQDVQGKKVLCLAGGGQQSVNFSLLGAHVTVFDLVPEQLESDKLASRHYGYEVTTVQGDLRDLSVLPKDHFDRVYQPMSNLFVPELGEVYSGVARILKPEGLYFSCNAFPLLYMAEKKGWDGKGYTLYVTEPYGRGPILETDKGHLNFTEGTSYSEFHHSFSDIFNGLIAADFIIHAVWEDPRPYKYPPPEELEPGSDSHQDRFLPYGFSVVAAQSKGKFSGLRTK